MADDAPTARTQIPAELMATVRELDLPEEILRDLEEVGKDPGEAGAVLMDAVEHLDLTDRSDQARRLMEALREHPPVAEDGQYASVDLLVGMWESEETGERARAERILEELLRPGNLEEGPAGLLAEYLAEFEELDKALYCYNIASRSLLAEPPESLGDLDLSLLRSLIGRTYARGRLGLAPDAHDLVGAEAAERYVREVGLGEELPDVQDPLPGWDEEPPGEGPPEPVREVRVAFSRETFDRARSAGLLGAHDCDQDPQAHYLDTERALREYSRHNPQASVYTALADADEIADFARGGGLEPAQEGTRRAWAEAGDGSRLRQWPPGRNQLCWCGSTRKYKKCCGSPSSR